MTFNELDRKLAALEKWRIDETKHGFASGAGHWDGRFLIPLDGQMWQVICGTGLGWKHVSVTNHFKKQIPTWDIMCRIKDLFFSDTDWVVQFHPPKTDYVNTHPFVLHLWMPTHETLPTPPDCMV